MSCSTRDTSPCDLCIMTLLMSAIFLRKWFQRTPICFKWRSILNCIKKLPHQRFSWFLQTYFNFSFTFILVHFFSKKGLLSSWGIKLKKLYYLSCWVGQEKDNAASYDINSMLRYGDRSEIDAILSILEYLIQILFVFVVFSFESNFLMTSTRFWFKDSFLVNKYELLEN